MGVRPGAEPFAADGGDVGVVLGHGVTGTPQRLRPRARELAAAGPSRSLDLVRAHSTTATGS